MSFSSNYKPSPLSFGSPRTSPFRRPESPSPSSPSTTVRATTPTPSPRKGQSPLSSPTKVNSPALGGDDKSWTPRGLSPTPHREMPGSPTRDTITTTGDMQSSPFTSGPKSAAGPNVDHRSNNDLSKLSAPQVRELREGFQLLDRDSDGLVTREDVVEMLNSLGQDSSARNVATFFPPSTPHPLTLPPFLTNLSALLAPISASDELLSAFAAFDDDDSGTVDVGELRDALLNTAPEDFGERPMTEVQVESAMRDFVGRKAFGGGHGKANRGGTRGDVFKYKDFVDSVRGGAQNGGVEVPTG